jgi:hypothetical protein
LSNKLTDILVLLFELLKVESLDDSLDLLVQLVVEILILKGSLIKLLIQATLLDSSVGHVVQLSKLNVVDGSLRLSEDLGQSGRLDLSILDLLHSLLLDLTIF